MNFIRPLAPTIALTTLAGSLVGCGTFGSSVKNAPTAEPAPSAELAATPTPTPESASASVTSDTAVQEPTAEPPFTTNVVRVSFAEEGADFDPCVSNDGARVVFASTQHRKTSDIYVKRVDSRVVTQLTTDPADDQMPSISPDGSKVAFASNRSGNWDIYVMPTTGGKAVQITSDTTDEIHPSWAPDGNSLVFNRLGEASGRWEMWVAATNSPDAANFIGYGLFPRWCPVSGTGADGADKVLFQLPRERGRRSFGLWTIDLANHTATNATEIAGSSDRALINPTWSPDGRWIAYAEAPASSGDGRSERPNEASLWMVGAEGDARVRLTSGKGVCVGPTWSGNNRLFFVSDRTGTENIWAMDMAPAVRSAAAVLTSGATALTKGTSGTRGNESKRGESADNTPVANVSDGGDQ